MEGEEQTTSTISPEFLENIQSAVNSQGVLGQVQVIETENGPVTVLFMEEGADTSNIEGDNITLTVTDGGNVDNTVVDNAVVDNAGAQDQNSQVQFQYQVQSDEDYSQFLESGYTTETVSAPEPVKEDVAATVEPVIGLPEEGTVENIEEKVGVSTDTYFITDTGEILKIDSSLLGDNSDATLQLQTKDGNLQILNQLGSVQTTSQVDTQLSFSQPTVEKTNITYEESAPFEYTATKVDSPLVIDATRVEEPKVLSYKTTNRQRTNIMRQPVSRSSPVTIQSKPVLTNQTVKTQTSLLTQSQYKTVKQVEGISNTPEVVYPRSYQKQTIVYPKIQKQTQFTNVIKAGQPSFQPKVKGVPQQMITTVMKPQSLLESSQALSSPAVNKLTAAQVPGSILTKQSLYTKKTIPELNRFSPQVINRQVPAVAKQQTDLLSVAMKQAEVPEQILSTVQAIQRKVAIPTVVKDSVPVQSQADKFSTEELPTIKESLQAFAKPVEEAVVSALNEIPEKQSSTVEQTSPPSSTEQTTALKDMVMQKPPVSVENADSQTDDLGECGMETNVEQHTEDEHPKVDQKADDQPKDGTDIPETDTSAKQVVIKCVHEKEKISNFNKIIESDKLGGEFREIEILNPDKNADTGEVNVSNYSEIGNENDANKILAINKEIKLKCTETSQNVLKKSKDKSPNKGIKEKVVLSRKIGSTHVKSLRKCGKCQFTTSKKSKFEQHIAEHDAMKLSPNQNVLENSIECEICCVVMPKVVYNKHVLKMHHPRRYDCEKCKWIFWSERSLKKHICKPVCKDDKNISDLRIKTQSTNHGMAKGNTIQKYQLKRKYASHKRIESSYRSKTISKQKFNSRGCILHKNSENINEILTSDKKIAKVRTEEELPVKHIHESLKITERKSELDLIDLNNKTDESAAIVRKGIHDKETSESKGGQELAEILCEQLSSSIEGESNANNLIFTSETDSDTAAETIEISDDDSISDTYNSIVEVLKTKADRLNTDQNPEKYASFKIVNTENQEVYDFCPRVVVEKIGCLDQDESARSKCTKYIEYSDNVNSSNKPDLSEPFEGGDHGVKGSRSGKASSLPNSQRLNRQLRLVHTGPFKCLVCKATFNKKTEYKTHRKTHRLRNTYQCSQCDKTFESLTQKYYHIRKEHKSPYLCEICGRKLFTKQIYLKHLKAHQGLRNFHCPMCDFGFNKKESLKKHEIDCGTEAEVNRLAWIKRSAEKNFLSESGGNVNARSHKCNMCSKSFVTLKSLSVHKKSIHNVAVKKTAVRRSHFSVLTVSELTMKEKKALSFRKNKFWLVNFPIEQMNECKMDEDTYTEMLQDDVVKCINIDGLKMVFQCDFCKQCFDSQGKVRAHVLVHKTVCSLCNRILHDYTALRRHRIFAHAGSGGKSIPCKKCKKEFCTENDLLYHMKIHVGPWICELKKCGANFSEKKDLNRHKRTHSEGKFVCVCERSFKAKESLINHVKVNGGKCLAPQWPDEHIVCLNKNIVDKVEPILDIPVSEVESYIEKGENIVLEGKGTIRAPYMCKVCDAQFVSASLTKNHILLRHCKNIEERSFYCSLCGFSTHRSDLMKTHQKTHQSIFKCDFCPSSFDQLEKLQKHVLYHLKDQFQCSSCSKTYVSRQACRDHILTSHAELQEKDKNLLSTDGKSNDADKTKKDHARLEEPGPSNLICLSESPDTSKQQQSEAENGLAENVCKAAKNLTFQKNDSKMEKCESHAVGELSEGTGFGDDVNEDNAEVQKSSIDLGNVNKTQKMKTNENEGNKGNVKSLKAQTISAGMDEEVNYIIEIENSGKSNLAEKCPAALQEEINKHTAEHVTAQKGLPLNEVNQQPMDAVDLNPSQQIQPKSSKTAYDNLVDQIGTILTEEVLTTATIGENTSSTVMPETQDVPDFYEYKGTVPDGLELYIPNVGPYICEGCGIPCDGQDNFKSHVQTRHTDGLRCKICNKKSTTQIILVAHMIDKHLDGKPLTCPKCKNAFKKVKTYWRHAEIHTKCFVCEVCSRPFRKKYDLTEHLHLHVESKKFCIRCGERFDNADQLRMHTWKVHKILLHKSKNRSQKPRANTQNWKWIHRNRRVKKINEFPEKNTKVLVGDVETASAVTETSGELAETSQASQASGEMKSIDVPDSDVTIQLFADGTLVTRDKAGTNYSQVKLEDLGLDLSMLEGNTDIELLIVQGDGKEVRATINTSTDVNPTTGSMTQVSKSSPSTTIASNAGQSSKEASTVAKNQLATGPANEARPYKCSMCPRTFKFYRTFRCHEIVHTKAITFTCHLCQRLFAREVNLQSHLELHKKKGAMRPTDESKDIKSRQCQLCKKIYADAYKLQRHIKEQHEKKKIPCPICGKLFTNEANIHRHAKIHVGPFTCPHCVKVFMERLEYYEHIKAEHADLMYTCKECEAILPSKKAFVSHTITQHSNAEELLEDIKDKECPVCNKKFEKFSTLENHMLMHNSEKTNECPACHKKYKHLVRLEQHIKEEHNNEVVFTCSECEEEFYLKGKLDLHVKLYHSGNYNCLTCYEEFPERLLLEEHQFHNHDISFVCSKCQNKFETSLKLKHHLKEHTSQNNLCDICGTGFEHKPQLRSHLTDKHFGRDKTNMLKQYPTMAKINVEILCDLCGEFWLSKPMYKQHLRDVHFGGDTVEMLKFFPFFEKISDPPEPATCDHCGKVCSSVHQLNFHLRTHMKSQEKVKAREEFVSTDDEQEDEFDLSNLEPREMDKNYRCMQCGAEFSRKASLDKHKAVHQKDEFKEALKEIEKEETARAELEEKEGRKPTPKTKKTATLSAKKISKINKPTKKAQNSPKVKLPFPQKSTSTAGTEKRRSSQMHICEVCEEIFKSNQELTVHMQDDHGDVDFKATTDTLSAVTESAIGTTDRGKPMVEFDLTTFQCFSCGKDFACRKYLRKHLNRVHNYKMKSSVESPKVNAGRPTVAKREQQLNDAKSAKTTSKKRAKKEKESEYEPMEESFDENTEDGAGDITSFLGKNFNLGKAHSCNIESVKKKQHRCNMCGEGFSREATLKKHIAFHESLQYTDIKPDIEDISDLQPAIYPCSSCGNMYSTALGLIHHNRSKHADVDEEAVLAQIAEVDEKFKLESPKKKMEKEPSKSTKRKLGIDADEMRESAKKRVKLDKDGKESFDCKFCGAVYYTFKGLVKHEQEVHGEYKVENPLSPVKYSHSGRLITKSKKLSEQIQCDKCSKTFLEEKNLKLHIQRVHKMDYFEKLKFQDITTTAESTPVVRFKCDLCPKEFDLRINLRRHMKMKHNVELPPETPETSTLVSPDKGKKLVYHCDVCVQKFSALSSLQHHLISIHDENDENSIEIKTEAVTCQICEQDFATEKTLEVHMRKHTGEKPYKCCLCNRQFISKYQLECHMKKLHSKLFAKKIKCKICLMLFETEKAMFKHKVIHKKPVTDLEKGEKIKSEPSLHKCDHCAKAFKWKRNLTSHVETYHKDSDPQTCGLCNKIFPDMASVKAHMVEHQKNAAMYTCNICDKSFQKESGLKIHEAHQHKPKSSPTGNSMSCDICKESFQTKLKLLEHMLTHTSVMPHKCEICSASFKQEFRLKAHKLSHKLKNKKTEKMKDTEKSKSQFSKEKESDKSKNKEVTQMKYKCKKCSKQFNKPWLLKTHIAKSHKPKLPVAMAFMKTRRLTRSRSASETSTSSGKKELPLKEKSKLSIGPLKKELQAKEKTKIKEKKLLSKASKKIDKPTGFCKKCNLNFIRIEAFDKHMKTVHQKSKKGESPRQAKEEKTKKAEKKILLKSGAKTVKTKKEEKSATKKMELVKGKKETIGHDCPICKKMFSKQFSLKNHIKNIHKVQVEKSPSNIELKRKKCLYCTECARVFWSQMQYDSHNRRFHPDKGALEMDKQVMQAMSSEIKTEPDDGFSLPNQTEFETVKHKCEFCSKVHWTKKLFDEHMLKEHPEHAHEYGISGGEDLSRPTIELVNDSEDMMGNLLSVGLYDYSACDKLSSLPVVSIQRIKGKLDSLITATDQQLPEMHADVVMEEQDLNAEVRGNVSTNTNIEELVEKIEGAADKPDNVSEPGDVSCIISSVKTLQDKEPDNPEKGTTKKFEEKDVSDANYESTCTSENSTVPEEPLRNENLPVQTPDQYSKEFETFLKNTRMSETEGVEDKDGEDSSMRDEEDIDAETAANMQQGKDTEMFGKSLDIDGDVEEHAEDERKETEDYTFDISKPQDEPLQESEDHTHDEEIPEKSALSEEKIVCTDNVIVTDCHIQENTENQTSDESSPNGQEVQPQVSSKDLSPNNETEIENENTEESENEKEQEGIDWEAIDNVLEAVDEGETVESGPRKIEEERDMYIKTGAHRAKTDQEDIIERGDVEQSEEIRDLSLEKEQIEETALPDSAEQDTIVKEQIEEIPEQDTIEKKQFEEAVGKDSVISPTDELNLSNVATVKESESVPEEVQSDKSEIHSLAENSDISSIVTVNIQGDNVDSGNMLIDENQTGMEEMDTS